MTFGKIFENFFGMVKLEERAYKETTKATFGMAALNFVMIAVAASLGQFWIKWDVTALVSSVVGIFIGLLITYFIATFVFWIFAKIFGGTGGYMAHYNGLSHIGLWAVLTIIPFIGGALAMLGSLWGIVMNVFYTRTLHKLSTGKAVAAVLIPYAIAFIIAIIIAVVAAAALYSVLSTNAMLA